MPCGVKDGSFCCLVRKVAILAAPRRELIRKSKTKKAVGCELVLQASCRSLRMLGALSSSLWAFGWQDPVFCLLQEYRSSLWPWQWLFTYCLTLWGGD